jgi:hypothetical protein
VWRWIPSSILYAASTIFLLVALRDTSVTALIVWRQLAPLPTMLAEHLLLKDAVYRMSCSALLGLIAIGLGVTLYSTADYEFTWLGTLFTLLSTTLLVWEGLLKRHLLTDTKEPLALSLQAMLLINNAVGATLALLLALSYELWVYGLEAIPNISADEIAYVLASTLLASM